MHEYTSSHETFTFRVTQGLSGQFVVTLVNHASGKSSTRTFADYTKAKAEFDELVRMNP